MIISKKYCQALMAQGKARILRYDNQGNPLSDQIRLNLKDLYLSTVFDNQEHFVVINRLDLQRVDHVRI